MFGTLKWPITNHCGFAVYESALSPSVFRISVIFGICTTKIHLLFLIYLHAHLLDAVILHLQNGERERRNDDFFFMLRNIFVMMNNESAHGFVGFVFGNLQII